MTDSGASADRDSEPAEGTVAVSLRAVTKVYDNGVVALRLIAGLSAPTSGTVRVARPAVTGGGGHSVGFVFQEPTLMPWTTVRENVRLPLKLAHVAAATANARIDAALAQMGLSEFAD